MEKLRIFSIIVINVQ